MTALTLSTIPPPENPVEHSAWDLQNLVEWLACRSDEELAQNLRDIERARNTLNQVIGRARKARPDAA